ncbi:hypothetical protein [Aliikangiella coralliicola]|uniref:Uncharacterized protein n=1 Tax=Aliikangiella coralliicola TaxID=2592383 RepID=A0A545U761_9GAMM|nr:hypothetical protein [Aliikangiella coralliicola]TQV85307.1 hypothetical protein FLL46_19260 [Aliikangiella coralliicola]
MSKLAGEINIPPKGRAGCDDKTILGEFSNLNTPLCLYRIINLGDEKFEVLTNTSGLHEACPKMGYDVFARNIVIRNPSEFKPALGKYELLHVIEKN